MAKIKLETTKKVKPKVKRANVHAKSKTSKLKSSKAKRKFGVFCRISYVLR